MNFVAVFALICLLAFSEAMPQAKHPRKVHIHGRPGDVVRDRTVIPDAPVLEEAKNIKEKSAVPSPVVLDEVSEVRDAPQQAAARKRTAEEEAELFKKQAAEAKYAFDSSIDDGINGQQHTRTEVRDGINVTGMYSYNDGFVKRTVQYEADDKGYRVIQDISEPVGDGPVYNLEGEAIVRSSLGSQYTITVDDIQPKKKKPAAAVA